MIFIIGFAITLVISFASFVALLIFTSPKADSFIIGLFFLTAFAAITSFAMLGQMLIFYLKRFSLYEHKKYRGVIFRRGIFLGGLVTFLLIFETMRRLTPLTGLAVLILFAGAEAYITYREGLAP